MWRNLADLTLDLANRSKKVVGAGGELECVWLTDGLCVGDGMSVGEMVLELTIQELSPLSKCTHFEAGLFADLKAEFATGVFVEDLLSSETRTTLLKVDSIGRNYTLEWVSTCRDLRAFQPFLLLPSTAHNRFNNHNSIL
ncbi:unnamed protein product [Protopolystoma xenopodis]|uniref:Uncharacterized protein n=1 Tax=Protopolystoma xenopodis TaxID=117903 RepID=A0A3S5AE38_9PLAT|nr:unnamed protein product [Protopolystoma xenopodis]